jgi:predicted nucleic acid-binding protein
MAVYLDTSAFVKLAVEEPESGALRAFLEAAPGPRVSSALLRVEAHRAVRRYGAAPSAVIREGLGSMDLVAISDRILETAATLEPDIVRTLDAIHLASALAIGDDLEVIVTYDQRMAAGARLLGLPAVAPER